jgi:hypothetical protein
MRQVQVRGCLPALLMLLVLGGLVALVVSASLAVALPVAAALLLLGLARSLWYRLTGRSPPAPFEGATFRTLRVDPRWTGGGKDDPSRDEGPIVDALPRAPPPPPGSGPDAG